MTVLSESGKRKSLIVKIFDYLTAMKKNKFVASFLGVKNASLYTLKSSISSDLFFLIEKNTSNFLAVSGYDRKPILIGYNHLSKNVIDSKFDQFSGVSEKITHEMLAYIQFLDISNYKPVLEKFSVHKYIMIMNNVEYYIQKNVYIYKNDLDKDVIEYYYQEFYTCINNDQLMFSNITPKFSLSILNKNNDINASTSYLVEQTNNDLDLIYDGILILIKGTDREGSKIFFNYEQSIQRMKERYLNEYYHGWQEIGYPQTTEDVQLLKMIAI